MRCDLQDEAEHCLGNRDHVAGKEDCLVVFDMQSSSEKEKRKTTLLKIILKCLETCYVILLNIEQ